MKAQLWSINVCGSVMEMSHGFSRNILEVYIPSVNISVNVSNVNVSNKEVNFFRTYEGRYHRGDIMQATLIREIDFPDNLVETIEAQLKSKEKFEKDIEGIFDIFKEFSEELPEPENPCLVSQLKLPLEEPKVVQEILCGACGYSGPINTFHPSISVYSDINCPECRSTNNEHNSEYTKQLMKAMRDVKKDDK